MFKGIRAKFLVVFITAVMITLIAAISVSYISIESVYMNINERNTNAEFNQILSEVESLLSEAEVLLSSNIISNSAARQLARYKKLTVPELSYAVRDLAKETSNITSNFRYIDSIYVYVADEWFLAMSDVSIRQLHDTEHDWPSKRIVEILSSAQTTGAVAGYIKEEDFPLEMREPGYLMLYRKAFHGNVESVYCVNLKESAFFDRYAGFMADGMREIRILDSKGVIISSEDKTEIGTSYGWLEGEDFTVSGAKNAENMIINYTPLTRYGLVIVSAIPSSVYTNELTDMRNRLLIVFVSGMVAISAFFYYWLGRKLKPIGALGEGMKCVGRGDYSKRLQERGTDELTELTKNYNVMLSDMQKLIEQRQRNEEELRERELAVLRNEINPHFLYNTLNTIKCMADMEENKEIARCIVSLGGIIAPLYKVSTPIWTLLEELCLVEKYLEIMNIRYANGIIYEENVQEELFEKKVMRFIMQPIMENAILHGFEERGYAGRIVLTAEVRENYLCLIVEDDGCGMSEEELQNFNASLKADGRTDGVGMMNVSRRIALRYGTEYGMILSRSVYGGLCVCIRLPLSDEDINQVNI